MIQVNFFNVDDESSNYSRYLVVLVKEDLDHELSSSFYYELTINNADTPSIVSIKEIEDCISYIFIHYGVENMADKLVEGKRKEDILKLIDNLSDSYKKRNDPNSDGSEYINNNNILNKIGTQDFLNIYNDPNTKSNESIYESNSEFIRDFLSGQRGSNR